MIIELVVGREKSVERIEIADYETEMDFIAEKLYKASLRHLMSHDVDATWDPETRTGTVYAGFHCVGKARVVE